MLQKLAPPYEQVIVIKHGQLLLAPLVGREEFLQWLLARRMPRKVGLEHLIQRTAGVDREAVDRHQGSLFGKLLVLLSTKKIIQRQC